MTAAGGRPHSLRSALREVRKEQGPSRLSVTVDITGFRLFFNDRLLRKAQRLEV